LGVDAALGISACWCHSALDLRVASTLQAHGAGGGGHLLSARRQRRRLHPALTSTMVSAVTSTVTSAMTSAVTSTMISAMTSTVTCTGAGACNHGDGGSVGGDA